MLEGAYEVLLLDACRQATSYGTFADRAEAEKVRRRLAAACGPFQYARITPTLADRDTRR